MSNAMPPMSAALAAFGVPATFNPVAGEPIETTAIRLRPGPIPAIGSLDTGFSEGMQYQDIISVPRSDVPVCQEGSEIVADFGDGSKTYRVDRVDRGFPDEWRMVVS